MVDMPSIPSLKKEHAKSRCEPGKVQQSWQGHQPSHTKSVHDGIRYSCNKCNNHYKTEAHLNRHRKYDHGGVKGIRYKCTQCDRDYKMKDGLTRHKKEEHGGVKRKRQHVGKYGSSVFNLKFPIVIHNRTKSYKCPACKVSFSRTKYLKVHIKKKHMASQKENIILIESFKKIVALENINNTTLLSLNNKSSRNAVVNFDNKLKKPKAFVKPLLPAEVNAEDQTTEMTNILVADNEEISEARPTDTVPALDTYDVMENERVLLEQREIEDIEKEWEELVKDEKDNFEKGVSSASFDNSDLVQEGVAQTNRPGEENYKKCKQCDQLFHSEHLFHRKYSLRRHTMVKHMDTNKQVQAETKKCGEPQKTGVTTTSKKSLQPFTEVLQLTVLAKVARQSSLPRTLARRPWSHVDESRVLERVRALQPGQVQALLDRRGVRVDISMDWVVRLCMVERGEAAEQGERLLACGCGKTVQSGRSFQTHQKWCRRASGNTTPYKKAKTDVEKGDRQTKINKDSHMTVQSRNPYPFHKITQDPILGFKVQAESVEAGVQVTTLHPSLLPALPCLPPASVSALQSLGRLTPRLLQGSISSHRAGTQTGLQQQVVRAWMDSIRICLPHQSSLRKPTSK